MGKRKRQRNDNVHPHSSENTDLLKDHNVGEGNDIISSLPENVLYYILSFLSTKDAIQTSILSRKWKYMWTSISNIDLDALDYMNRKKEDSSFLDFVDRVLHLHDASDIRSLRVRLSEPVSSSRVNLWISILIRHKIKELDLSLHWETQPILPCCLFTCESLVVLKLSMEWVLKVPSLTQFSNLKTLELECVAFLDENSAQHLFSSCPVLEELALVNCEWKNLKTIMICIPTLKILTIDNDFGPGYVLSCVTKIYAPNLIRLHCSSCLMVDFRLYDLSSLVDAYVCLFECLEEQVQVVTPRALRLLAGIVNVKKLSIGVGTLECLSVVENLLDRLPTFYNMTHLVLMHSELHGGSSRELIYLLEKSPNLESLTFEEGFNEDGLDEANWMFGMVPSCFKSSLKTVHINDFDEQPIEMEFIRFLLEYATVLERLTLGYLGLHMKQQQQQQKVSKKLNELPRGSKCCVIELISR